MELSRTPDASLNAIAKRAGVGAGTLYRHFPNRESLVLEVYRREVEQLVASAPSLLARLAPDAALREWMDRLAQFTRLKPGLALALREATVGDSETMPGYLLVSNVIGDLLSAGQQAGSIRSDVVVEDFILVTAGLWMIDPAQDWDVRAARLLDFVMDGLRVGIGS